ncbi:Cytochrome P450, E-class, group I [Penicillium griseofulvum]|uniref:Cytochrome P450, E-class, group I n=1 Tax=Penicillium patulum TaxID=5078 RepID=A0A135LKU8_PENPA|nr:Cytochrome P450, E-class, group I [Penicillium griseofulvum]KXG49530.1 Cytochrome P450, E-class, group I [Penicillium griseofulvum]
MLDYGKKDAAIMLGYAFILSISIWSLMTYLLSPLRRFPGPFFADWTNLWRMLHVRRGNCHMVIQELHKKYGPVVRIGPNVLDFDIPELINTIYNIKSDYLKVNGLPIPDFLDKFIEAKEKCPEVVDDMQVISYLMINMIAGADTTGVTINAALYFSLKHPHVWERLRTEILAYDTSESTVISYKSAKQFTYLNAVVRGAMRCHPAVAMLLERYVPEDGLTLPNRSLVPAGSIVGINPYIVGRNKSVWGDDAEEFRPERWLRDEPRETEDAFQERLLSMNKADLSFGGGSRSCIGEHLGLLEVYKVIATLVSRYDIKLAHPEKDWKTHNSFFVRQTGIEVKLTRRT